jgi:hypothetical protein
MTKLSSLLVLPILAASLFISANVTSAADAPARAAASPILVELFTSEGCSDCPPADALLQQFDSSQPVAGAQLIVLSEHVDYWNYIGWTDPYSARFFSDRQTAYTDNFKLKSAYTPQMVVDGSAEFVGNNPNLATQALQKAVAQKKIPVRISEISLDTPHVLRVHVEADALPDTSAIRKAEVYLAVALNHAESQVSRGENGGHRLTHVSVVQSLNKIGNVEVGKGFAQEVRAKLDPRTDLTNLRVVVFVQQPGQRQVLGAALEKVSK